MGRNALSTSVAKLLIIGVATGARGTVGSRGRAEKLERFMANPDELVPGNRMKLYGGLASTDDRARIVSFLRSVASGR